MMNFKQWQVINETYGHYNLGVKSPRSVGTVGSKLAEMGLETDDMTDDLSGAPMDDLGGLGGLDDMGGGDDLGDDLGGDLGGLGGGLGGDPEAGKIKLDDLHPSLIQLLGLQMHKGKGGDDEGDDDGDEGGSPFGGGSSSPFGGGSDDDGDSDDDEGGSPFGGASDSDSDTDGDGETDDTDGDDDDDGEADETDSDPKDSAKKSKKFMGAGGKCCDKPAYSKKFMGKGCMKPMGVEEQSFFSSLVGMGRGEVRQKFESGVPAQKRRLEPRPGDVGYAPQGRMNTFPSVTEWTQRRARKGKSR